MAYVSAADYDIFISYARIDDEIDTPGGVNWVSTFVSYLNVALKKRLGGTDALKIFFDRTSMNSNDALSELKRAAKNSALFLAICSRSYASRSWTKAELEAFTEANSDEKRLFAIEIMPLDAHESYPPRLENRHREPFFAEIETMRGTTVPLPPSDPRFGHLIHDLAEQIRGALYAIRAVDEVKAAASQINLRTTPAPQTPTGAARPKVFLGQTTDDVDFEREQMRRYLEQFGHPTLPLGDFRQDKDGFEADTRAGLAEADLFVQLLGLFPGRRAPGMAATYSQTQLDLAKELGVPVVQWRASNLQMDMVSSPDHIETLTGPDVVVSGLETFKAEVKERLVGMAAQHVAAPVVGTDGSLPVVFINADRPDLEYARWVRDEFAQNGFLASIPLDRGDERDLQSYLRENLIECDGLVMIYGDTSPIWATRSLRHFNKLRANRETPPRLVAVVVGPPDGKAQDLGVSMPDLRVVGSTDGWQDDAIGELIEAFS